MAVSSTEPAVSAELPRIDNAARRWRPELIAVGVIGALAIVLTLSSRAHHLHAVPDLARGSVASLLLFAVCGEALAYALVPRSWGVLRQLLVLPLGAGSSGLVLTAFGFARVPLQVSLWVVLALGLAASVLVHRRPRRSAPRVDRVQLGCWTAVLFIVFCVALIPAWRTGSDTIFGENPDAHQVAGIAVLFQHVTPPTATDNALPIDTVPPSWRFRYPIFYGLAAAGNLSHEDPIRVFPTIAALLIVISALGFGAIATRFLGVPAAGGMAVAAVIGFWFIALHLGWHPYWNQLWGFAMLPYALLFGWQAVTARDKRALVLFALMVVTLWLAYPLALPYPLVLVLALAVGYLPRPRIPHKLRARSWIAILVAFLLLLPAVVGAAVKLGQGLSQVLSPHSTLWSGDVTHLMPIGRFVGTGGGVVPALGVLALAVLGLLALPRRPRLAFGAALLVLCLVDLRFRLVKGGAYMDFKHLSFVGGVVLMLATVAVCRLVLSRRPAWLLAGGLAAIAWTAAALVQDQRDAMHTEPQVSAAMFQLRDWASRLPPGASVRVDIPPTGVQLWAVYMLGDHPVDSPTPVMYKTYAHPRLGHRADYSLSLRYYPSVRLTHRRLYPTPAFAQNPPVFQNGQFVLRKIDWPAAYSWYPDTSSTALVEP